VSKSLIVRYAAPNDFDEWLTLWDGYNEFYERVGDTALPREITELTWRRFFDGYEPMHAIVAELDGKLVGLVHFLYHRHTTMAGPICYLQDLYAATSQRGQGIGRALIEAVYREARQAGAARVYWQTQETNTVAMKLYDRLATKSGFLVYRQTL
jgi:GNAT superfamily N-acetyltransferase